MRELKEGDGSRVCVWRRKIEFDLAEFVFEKEDHRESEKPEYRVIKFFFFNIMLTWKIVRVLKVSVIYIYIYIYITFL